MSRLTRKDNNTFRRQEWRLLFAPGAGSSFSSAASSSSSQAHSQQQQPSNSQTATVPDGYANDTFLVKAFFSEAEKYYLILLSNLKQTWYEKLELDAIRQRSKLIPSFAYEEDAQVEALLLSLSTVFTTAHNAPAASTSKLSSNTPSKQLIQARHGKLYLIVGFEFGLANVSWKFKLSPMIVSTADVPRTLVKKTAATFSPQPLFPSNLSLLIDEVNGGGGGSGSGYGTGGNKKRARTFLEDSEDEYDDDGIQEFALDDEEELEEDQKNANGVSVLFDHLILPLIALNNAYRKQTRTLEVVIKNKESEVTEALELLEQHGVNYHNRRRATERFDKARVDTKLQEDVEQLLVPQLMGPRDLFSDRRVASLCSIVSRNAGDHVNSSLSQLDRNISSMETGSSQPSSASRRTAGGEYMSLLRDVGASVPAPAVANTSDRAGDNSQGGPNSKDAKAGMKEAEELERRRILQEKLDREKAEKEKSRKKKRLF